MIPFGLLAAAALAAPPQVGDLAPELTATDEDGKTVSLSAMLKDGPLILAFYPKAFSPG